MKEVYSRAFDLKNQKQSKFLLYLYKMFFKRFYCHLILVKTWCHNQGRICTGLCHFPCHFNGVPGSCEIEITVQVEALVNERSALFYHFCQQVIVIW